MNPKHQIPKPKHQIEPKLQAPKSELLSEGSAVWYLRVGVLLVFGVCCLVFAP